MLERLYKLENGSKAIFQSFRWYVNRLAGHPYRSVGLCTVTVAGIEAGLGPFAFQAVTEYSVEPNSAGMAQKDGEVRPLTILTVFPSLRLSTE
jgi:hypothetical protein